MLQDTQYQHSQQENTGRQSEEAKGLPITYVNGGSNYCIRSAWRFTGIDSK